MINTSPRRNLKRAFKLQEADIGPSSTSDDETMGPRRGGRLLSGGGGGVPAPPYSKQDIREQYCITSKQLDVFERHRASSGGDWLLGCLSSYQEGTCRAVKRSSLLSVCVRRRAPSDENLPELCRRPLPPPALRHRAAATAADDDDDDDDEDCTYLRRRLRYPWMPEDDEPDRMERRPIRPGVSSDSEAECDGPAALPLSPAARCPHHGLQLPLPPPPPPPAQAHPSGRPHKHVSFARSHTLTSFDVGSCSLARSRERLVDGKERAAIRPQPPADGPKVVVLEKLKRAPMKTQATQTDVCLGRRPLVANYLSLSPRTIHRVRMVSQFAQTNGGGVLANGRGRLMKSFSEAGGCFADGAAGGPGAGGVDDTSHEPLQRTQSEEPPRSPFLVTTPPPRSPIQQPPAAAAAPTAAPASARTTPRHRKAYKEILIDFEPAPVERRPRKRLLQKTLSEGEMLRVGVGPVGGGGGGTGATPPARLPPDEPLEKQKRAFASTPAGLSAVADEDEFHENLIFRGLFRKRSVSLEDAGPASLGPLDSPAAGEFHSAPASPEPPSPPPTAAPATAAPTTSSVAGRPQLPTPTPAPAPAPAPRTQRSSPSASCDSLAGELRTDHSDGIWNESQATVLQAGEGGGLGLDTECGAVPGSPGSLAMTPSSRRKHLLLLQHQQRSSMDTDALDEELDLSDVTQPQQPLSPRICIDAPVQQANSGASTCNERLERYSQDSAGLSPRRSSSPLGHRTSEASAASSLESCDRFSRNGTGTGNTTMTNTTTTTTSSELARTDSGRTNTDLSETSEDYVTADGNSHTDTAGYVAWPVGTPVSAPGGVGAAGAGAGRRGEGDGSSFESGSSLYSVPAAAEETSSELQTTTTPTPLVDSEDNGDADATRAGSSTPRVSVDMGYGALRLMANSPSDESSSSSGSLAVDNVSQGDENTLAFDFGSHLSWSYASSPRISDSYSVEGSRDDLDKMLDQHPLSPVQNHNSSNHSNHSNHAGDDHEEVEARAVAGGDEEEEEEEEEEYEEEDEEAEDDRPPAAGHHDASASGEDEEVDQQHSSASSLGSPGDARREWTEEERRRRKKTFRLDFSPLGAGPHTDWDSPPSTGSRTTPDGWRRGGTPPGAPTQAPSATSTAPRRSKVAQAHRRQAKKCLAAGMVRSPAMHEGFRADDWAAPLQRSTPGHSPPEGAAPGGGNGGGGGGGGAGADTAVAAAAVAAVAGAAVAGGGTSDESSGRQEAAGAGPAAGAAAGATPSGSSPRRVRRIRERKAGGRSPTQARVRRRSNSGDAGRRRSSIAVPTASKTPPPDAGAEADAETAAEAEVEAEGGARSSRLSPLRYTRSPAGSPSRRRRSKGSPSRNTAAAAGADAKEGVASPEAQRLKALSAESLRSVSPGSDSVFYSEAGELSSNTMTAATDTAAGVVCHHCGREVAVLSGPEELESTAADGPSPDIVQPPAGFADSPEGPRQQAQQQQQQQQPRLYKKADRRFRSEERHGERRHTHSTGRYRCDGARAKSEERGRGREDRVRLRPLARSTDASMETLRAGDATAAAEDAGPPDGAPAAPPAEGDEDAGVYAETYKKATWIYIGETEEVHVWQKPESRSQDKDDKASDGTSERRDSLESTISERDFRRKYQAITHRMVHRKATVEMYRRLANDSFADPPPAGRTSLRRNLEELLKTMLRVWAKQVVAVSVTGGRPCDCDKTVVVRRQSGEFGFRIHGSKPVVVSAIEPDTPAESSGLEVGDIVITVNGHDVLDASHSEVVKLAHAGSETLKLGVARTANVLTPVLREPGAGKALYSGFLWRLGGAGGTTWVRRWFSLKRDNCLYYYKTDAESLPLGALMLHRYAASRCEAAGRQHCLQLARKGGLGLTLAADSEEALTRWLAVLSHAIERNNHADEWLEATQRALRLPASSVLQPDCAGYLTQIGPKWRRRFCVLKDACLYFYQDSTADSAIGMVCLHGYRVQNCGTGEKRLSFEVLPPDARQRHFYFHAESELDKKKWLAALEYSIDRWIRVG